MQPRARSSATVSPPDNNSTKQVDAAALKESYINNVKTPLSLFSKNKSSIHSSLTITADIKSIFSQEPLPEYVQTKHLTRLMEYMLSDKSSSKEKEILAPLVSVPFIKRMLSIDPTNRDEKKYSKDIVNKIFQFSTDNFAITTVKARIYDYLNNEIERMNSSDNLSVMEKKQLNLLKDFKSKALEALQSQYTREPSIDLKTGQGLDILLDRKGSDLNFLDYIDVINHSNEAKKIGKPEQLSGKFNEISLAQSKVFKSISCLFLADLPSFVSRDSLLDFMKGAPAIFAGILQGGINSENILKRLICNDEPPFSDEGVKNAKQFFSSAFFAKSKDAKTMFGAIAPPQTILTITLLNYERMLHDAGFEDLKELNNKFSKMSHRGSKVEKVLGLDDKSNVDTVLNGIYEINSASKDNKPLNNSSISLGRLHSQFQVKAVNTLDNLVSKSHENLSTLSLSEFLSLLKSTPSIADVILPNKFFLAKFQTPTNWNNDVERLWTDLRKDVLLYKDFVVTGGDIVKPKNAAFKMLYDQIIVSPVLSPKFNAVDHSASYFIKLALTSPEEALNLLRSDSIYLPALAKRQKNEAADEWAALCKKLFKASGLGEIHSYDKALYDIFMKNYLIKTQFENVVPPKNSLFIDEILASSKNSNSDERGSVDSIATTQLNSPSRSSLNPLDSPTSRERAYSDDNLSEASQRASLSTATPLPLLLDDDENVDNSNEDNSNEDKKHPNMSTTEVHKMMGTKPVIEQQKLSSTDNKEKAQSIVEDNQSRRLSENRPTMPDRPAPRKPIR